MVTIQGNAALLVIIYDSYKEKILEQVSCALAQILQLSNKRQLLLTTSQHTKLPQSLTHQLNI